MPIKDIMMQATVESPGWYWTIYNENVALNFYFFIQNLILYHDKKCDLCPPSPDMQITHVVRDLVNDNSTDPNMF